MLQLCLVHSQSDSLPSYPLLLVVFLVITKTTTVLKWILILKMVVVPKILYSLCDKPNWKHELWTTSFGKIYFSTLAGKLNMGLINKGWDSMFFACEVWRIADVSSVSRWSEQKSLLSKRYASAILNIRRDTRDGVVQRSSYIPN